MLSLSSAPGKKSCLETFLSELLLEILSYLPLESQACFAICSRTLAKKLGTRYLLALREKRNGALLCYFQLLQRDRLSFYCCHECLRLHSVDGNDHVKPENEFFDWSRRGGLFCGETYLLLGDEALYVILFHHIQLAMARHRRDGSLGGRLDTLRHILSNWSGSEIYKFPTPTRIFDTKARVVSDHLLIRTQNLVEMDFSSNRSPQNVIQVLNNTLCRHFFRGTSSRSFQQCLEETKLLLECPRTHDTLAMNGCQKCGFVPLCPCCPSEISIQKVQIGPGRLAIVITQWRNLGTGSAPGDRVWQAHSAYSPQIDLYPGEFESWGWTEARWGLRNIRKRFEQQQGVDFEALTTANIKKSRAMSLPVHTFEALKTIAKVVKKVVL